MIKKYLPWVFVLASSTTYAQSELDRVLTAIAKNNISIKAERQLQQAEKLQYQTGLNPENPRIDYEYLPGSPSAAGTQKDIAVTQAFDFPTSYLKRRDFSRNKISQSDLQFNIFRQEVMLRAKQTCIEYVYRAHLSREFERRQAHAESLLEATSKKVEQGEANILDLNKVRLMHVEIRQLLELNAMEIKNLQHRIDEMNGGIPVDLSTIEYPVMESLPGFQTLDSAIEANDPEVTAMKHNRVIQRNELELTRALSLPKFEGGYHRQSILNQTYQGFHIGMTIPLWENKNTVKVGELKLRHSEVQLSQHRTRHLFENKQLYEQYTHWQSTYSAYRDILSNANNEALLTKALQAGELSLIEYLMELQYFYDAMEKLAFAEKENHRILAELYKFQL